MWAIPEIINGSIQSRWLKVSTHLVRLTTVWEQLNIARTFRTTQIWILNVGDLKLLETPLEYFMELAYDSDRWPKDSLKTYLAEKAKRDFGDFADDIAEIMLAYSVS